MNKYFLVGKIIQRLSKVSLVMLLSFIIIACGETSDEEAPDGSESELAAGILLSNTLVSSANWNSRSSSFVVSGAAYAGDTKIFIFDDATRELVQSADVDSNGLWQIVMSSITTDSVPCKIHVDSKTSSRVSAYQKVIVNNAPSDCGLAYKTVSSSSDSNEPPQGRIITPSSSVSVVLGSSLTFNGTASDPDGDSNFTYFWDFGDYESRKIGSSTTVKFSKVGSLTVQLLVKDSSNLYDPTPASVVVTVVENVVNSVPNGSIVTPSIDRTINVGDSVAFTGSGTDVNGDTLRYLWDFGTSGIPRNMNQSTGNLVFNKAGTFVVSLMVTDSLNATDPTPDKVTIVVNSLSNRAPNGEITQPNINKNITVGSSVNFASTSTDPDGNSVVYLWDFGASGIARSTVQNPGNKTFNKAGIYYVTLTVKDSKGLADPTPGTIRVTVNALSNRAPNGEITKPGNNVSVKVGDSVNFASTSSDPDGNSVAYLWDFGASGITRSTVQNPGNKIFNKAGIYNVALTVKDSKGLADATPDTVKITVAASNGAPNGLITSPASALAIKVGESINFTGSSTDPDGDAVSYSWDFGTASIPKSTQLSPGSTVFNKVGTHTVTLTVKDNKGLADPTPASVTVTVSDVIVESNGKPNGFIVSPLSNAITISAGDTLNLRASGTDPDGDLDLTYSWSMGSYAPSVSGQNVSLIFDEPGVVTVKLNVRDSTKLLDPTPDTLIVSVLSIEQINQAPDSKISVPSTNQTIDAGEAIFFSGLATDPENNTPLSYFWNFDGAAPNSTMQNPGYVVFPSPGVYRVTLSSTDNSGSTDTTPAVRIVTVNGDSMSPPNSLINSPSGDRVIRVGESIRFSGSGADLDNDTPYSYLWNFDGVAPNEQIATPGNIKFANAGVYNVSLRVTDSSGAKDPTPATVKITVTNIDAQNEPPHSTIITPSMGVVIFEGDSVTFRGTGNDPDGDLISYYWNFDGAAVNTTANNPGNIQFTQAGVFNISFITTDSNGLADATPATVKVIVRATPSSVAPDSVITSPSTWLRINEGDTVNFSGYGSDADGNTPLSYLWNFDGAMPNVRTEDPGNVVFNNPGIYRVRFSVTDSTGLIDPTPAERIIFVDGVNQTENNLEPSGSIDSPTSDVVVFVGQTINFAGSGVDPDGNGPLSYRWNFGGVVPDTTAKNPGLVSFTQVGTYRVALTVTDSLGSSDSSPAERLVTVIGNATQNQSPNGTIVKPNIDQTISVNGVVDFTGSGTDPDNNTPLTYRWDFDGAVPNVTGPNPGNVTFKKAGDFIVTLSVIDSQGAVDSTPDQVTIHVSEGGGNNGGTNTGNNSGGANWPVVSPASSALTLNAGDSYTFVGESIGNDGEQSSFAYWNFNGYTLNAIGNSVTKTFDRVGKVIVDYKVKDANGDWADVYDSITITVQ